jgi:hypothetical protein
MFIIQVLGRILRMIRDGEMKNLDECWFISPREDIIDEYVGSMAASVQDLTSELVEPDEEEAKDNTTDNSDNLDSCSDISDSETKDETIQPITNLAVVANQSTIRHIEDSFQIERDPDIWRLAQETSEITNGSAEEWYEQMISNQGVRDVPTPVIHQSSVQPSLNDKMLALRKDISKQVNKLSYVAKRYCASEWPLWKIWLKVKGQKIPLSDFTYEELTIMREEKLPRVSTQIKRSRPRPSSNIPAWAQAQKKPRN